MESYSNAPSALHKQLMIENEAMAKYALSLGLKVPPSLVELLEDAMSNVEKTVSLRRITYIHEQLTQIVSPAHPDTILLLDKERRRKSFWQFMGPVPLVRSLMFVSIVSLIAMVAISVSAHVDGHVDWKNETGWKLLLEELFLITAASLGASFYALFQVNQYIINNTFNSNYSSSYWIRIVLGIVAGMMLAMLIPIDPNGQNFKELTKPLLALIGGFSVTVVYRALNRFVTTVDSLIRGDPKDSYRAEKEKLNAQIDKKRSEDRLKMINHIALLREKIATRASHDNLYEFTNQFFEEVIDDSGPPFKTKEKRSQSKE